MVHVIVPCQAGDSLRDALASWKPFQVSRAQQWEWHDKGVLVWQPTVFLVRPNGLELWVPLGK